MLQSLNQQASRVKRDGAAEMSAVDAKGLKLDLSGDLMTARNAQFKAMSELPAAEMIGKASRLQQVPLSTALASSLPASANVNAAPSVHWIRRALISMRHWVTGWVLRV